MDKDTKEKAFGPNSWLVEEMYRQYEENPQSVGESWRDFFEDYKPSAPADAVATQRPPEPSPAEPERGAAAERKAAPSASEDATPLRGVAARISENMEASLGLPTATSVRSIPAKLLEENRRVINRYIGARRGGKVSFTHLIAWAVLKGLPKTRTHPSSRSAPNWASLCRRRMLR